MLIKKLIIVMHYISKWKQFLMVEDDMDSHEVAKAVIVTSDNKVLILKRSEYMAEYA